MKGIKGFPKGKNHHLWKGDDVGYKSLHAWLNRTFGSPNDCEDCHSKTAKKYEWANISGSYKRIRKDWKRLCTPCHIKFDKRYGEGNGESKLTTADVIHIRLKYQFGGFSYRKLSNIFGVGKTTISNVVKGRTWRHLL